MVKLEMTLRESTKVDNHYEFEFKEKSYKSHTNKIHLSVDDVDLIPLINKEIFKEEQIDEIIFNWKWKNER